MNTETTLSRPHPVLQFLRAPFELRSYANLLYLALAFPLGLFYFVFLVTGFSLGVGLTIIWIGLPILALVFAGSWGMAALERQLAIALLGAEVPPMTPAAPAEPQGFWRRIQDFLSNPVTWKGIGYLLIKFPLGVFTFTLLVTLLSLTAAFLLTPVAYSLGLIQYDWDGGVWVIDTLAEALVCGAFGALLVFVTLSALNGLAWVWGRLASVMLGSERFAVQPPAAA